MRECLGVKAVGQYRAEDEQRSTRTGIHPLSLLNATTPVILTFNEAPNLERTLSGLSWAADIVVVDSGRTDGTLDILARQKNVRVFHRPFDTHAAQWRYAVFETGIESAWVLRLDADYHVPPAFPAEIAALPADAPCDILLFVEVFCHLRRGQDAAWLRKARELLAPGGCIVIIDKERSSRHGRKVKWDLFKRRWLPVQKSW